jgi:hypothetical protein
MSSGFRDQTVTWFRQGEDEDRLRATPEPYQPPPKSRLSNVMLAVATATLLGSCALYLVLHGIPRPHGPLPPPLQIQVAK